MWFRSSLLLVLTLVPACRPQGSDSGPTQRGTVADSEVTGSGSLSADTAGVELEAPRLIPGMLATLQLVEERGGRMEEGNVTAYRQAASSLVDAMLTDLNRLGSGDDGSFRALGDSVVALVGGGAGDAPEAEPEAMLRSAGMMRRQIEIYQERMRAVRD